MLTLGRRVGTGEDDARAFERVVRGKVLESWKELKHLFTHLDDLGQGDGGLAYADLRYALERHDIVLTDHQFKCAVCPPPISCPPLVTVPPRCPMELFRCAALAASSITDTHPHTKTCKRTCCRDTHNTTNFSTQHAHRDLIAANIVAPKR